jgi:hypothetical protein
MTPPRTWLRNEGEPGAILHIGAPPIYEVHEVQSRADVSARRKDFEWVVPGETVAPEPDR